MRYNITKYEIENKKIKEKIKFAILADMHTTRDEKIIEIIKKENVNAILIPGDFIDDNSRLNMATGKAFLKKVSRVAPVYYAFGNHEEMYGINPSEFTHIDNLKLLINEDVKYKGIKIGGSAECIGDLNWVNIFKRNSKEFKILIRHKPEKYKEEIKENGIDLMISGHAHGGQIRIFGQGLYAPGQGVFPKYTSGIIENKLIISRGLCNTAPFFIPRLFNRPELVFLTIKPSQKASFRT